MLENGSISGLAPALHSASASAWAGFLFTAPEDFSKGTGPVNSRKTKGQVNYSVSRIWNVLWWQVWPWVPEPLLGLGPSQGSRLPSKHPPPTLCCSVPLLPWGRGLRKVPALGIIWERIFTRARQETSLCKQRFPWLGGWGIYTRVRWHLICTGECSGLGRSGLSLPCIWPQNCQSCLTPALS